MNRITLIAASLAICVSAAAQPSGHEPGKHHGPRPQLTVEQEAQMHVDEMSAELPLTARQVKKLTRFYKKDIQYRRDNFQGGAPGTRPEGGPGPGGSRGDMHHGGGPGQGGPGGGMGPGGGRPGGDRPGGGPGMRSDGQGGRPPMQDAEIDFEKLEKYNARQEKKLSRILGEPSYTQWRSRHPQEHPQLPDIQLDLPQN